MPAGILRQMLRDKIEGFLPAGALKVIKAAEESERAGLVDGGEAYGRQCAQGPARADAPGPAPADTAGPVHQGARDAGGAHWDNAELIHDLAKHWPWNSDMLLEANLLT